jgi:hypothetical protein
MILFIWSLLFIFVSLIIHYKPVYTKTLNSVPLLERLASVREQSYASSHTDAARGQPGRRSIALSPEKFADVYVYLDAVTKSGYRVSRDVPIEHRVYFTGSRGMDWHADERVLPGDYYEVVLTLFNDSDSMFEYRPLPFVTRRFRTTPGTMVFVRPQDVPHRVTPVTRGSREILKYIVVKANHVHGS